MWAGSATQLLRILVVATKLFASINEYQSSLDLYVLKFHGFIAIATMQLLKQLIYEILFLLKP